MPVINRESGPPPPPPRAAYVLCRALQTSVEERPGIAFKHVSTFQGYVYSSCIPPLPSPVPSFISFLRLILVSSHGLERYSPGLIPHEYAAGFPRAPAKVDFPFLPDDDVDAANKSPSSTFKRCLSSYALCLPRLKYPYPRCSPFFLLLSREEGRGGAVLMPLLAWDLEFFFFSFFLCLDD